ncbi:unnamed protein product [Rotaria sp. Silwood1]|nr:unnamed protein product [Rotaria sp. Silwood1]
MDLMDFILFIILKVHQNPNVKCVSIVGNKGGQISYTLNQTFLNVHQNPNVKCVSIVGNKGDQISYTLNQIFLNG